MSPLACDDGSEGPVYVFFDESGNFDFSPKGTPFYVFGALSTRNPVALDTAIARLHYELLVEREHEHCFHATADKQAVRDRVFSTIGATGGFDYDCVIVEKAKTNPSLRDELKFYPKFAGYALRYVLERTCVAASSSIIVITDSLPMKKRREAVNKAVRGEIRRARPDGPFTLVHHDTAAHGGLQIADYCTWAIHKKWTNNERRPYNDIRQFVRSEFDIFASGDGTKYY